MRMTKHRKAILNLFKSHKPPMNAEMIMEHLIHKNEISIDLSTIYRTLDVLYNHGIVSKSIASGTAYYHLNTNEHHHFIICLHCKKMSELDCHIDEELHKIEMQSDFKIIQHDLTFYGYCKDCDSILHP